MVLPKVAFSEDVNPMKVVRHPAEQEPRTDDVAVHDFLTCALVLRPIRFPFFASGWQGCTLLYLGLEREEGGDSGPDEADADVQGPGRQQARGAQRDLPSHAFQTSM